MPDDGHSTMQDVAREAKVSLKTVSRVVRNTGPVSDHVTQKVNAAIAHLGFTPNTIASSLASGRTTQLGVIVETVGDPFFSAFLQRVYECVSTRYTLLVATSNRDPTQLTVTVESLLRSRIAGLLMTPPNGTEIPTRLQDLLRSVPLVTIDTKHPSLPGSAVITDDHNSAYTATSHLIMNHHEAILFIGGERDRRTTQLRFSGYLSALKDHNIAYDHNLVHFECHRGTGARYAVDHAMQLSSKPTAIFSTSLRCSLGAIPAVYGMSDRPAFLAFDDAPLFDSLDPPITAIDHDPNTLGETAAVKLLEAIDNPSTSGDPSTTVIPGHLTIRRSHEPPPVPVSAHNNNSN